MTISTQLEARLIVLTHDLSETLRAFKALCFALTDQVINEAAIKPREVEP